jgi:F0F1-type ATP synthase assembly protein I
MDIALFHFALDGSMTALNAQARQIVRRSATRRPPHSPDTSESDGQTAGSTGRTGCLALFGAMLLCAPFGSLSDKEVYTGPLALDILKGIGIFAACWIIGGAILGYIASRGRPGPHGRPSNGPSSGPV